MKTIFLILLLSLGAKCFAQTDPSNWDPSDPNCPCHKLAQQADEEWANANLNADTNAKNVVPTHDPVSYNTDIKMNNPVAVVQNNYQTANDSVPATATTTSVVSSGSSGGSSYYHYSVFLFEWRSFWKGIRKFRRRLGNRHSGKLKHNFRVANCFEF